MAHPFAAIPVGLFALMVLLRLSASLAAATVVTPKPVEALGTPFTEEAFWAPVLAARASRFHGVLNLEVTDHYVTLHGLNIENQGIVFQPLLVLAVDLYSKPKDFLSGVTLTAGGWSSIHEHRSGKVLGNVNEADAFAGLTFTFARDWSFSSFYSGYFSQTHNYPTAWELAFTVGYNDERVLGPFALHPYLTYTRQTEGKTSVVFRKDRTNESYELRLGIDPGYQFKAIPVKVEFPTFVTYVPNNFYQRSTLETKSVRIFGFDYSYQQLDGAGGGAGIGFFSTAARVSMPLDFVWKRAGRWTVYAAAQYYRFNNPGLIDGNQALGASSKRERELVQFHGGLSVSF